MLITPFHAALVRSTRQALTDLQGVRRNKPVAQKKIKASFLQTFKSILTPKAIAITAVVSAVIASTYMATQAASLTQGLLIGGAFFAVSTLSHAYMALKTKAVTGQAAKTEKCALNAVRRNTRNLAHCILKAQA